MFTRAEFKEKAKAVIKGNYWTCFLVCLLIGLIGGIESRITNRIEVKLDAMQTTNINGGGNLAVNLEGAASFIEPAIKAFSQGSRFLLVVLPYLIVGFLVTILITVFVRNMLEVGRAKFFIEARNGQYLFEHIFTAYKNGSLKNQALTMFFRDLYISLWTLLFVIPGIVCAYRYRFVPYILAEHPDMDYHEVLAMSSEMTNGIKMDLFILDLSFFGWHLLALVTFGISEYFVSPYVEATDAEVYAAYAMSNYQTESY